MGTRHRTKTKNGLSRDTGNDWAQGTEQRQRMDYLEIQATIGHKAGTEQRQRMDYLEIQATIGHKAQNKDKE